MPYRSAIFYLDEEQQQTAITLIRELTDAHIYPNPILTAVTPASDFRDAEEVISITCKSILTDIPVVLFARNGNWKQRKRSNPNQS